MFERFTDRARRVIVLAQEEARTLQHNYIGTEHLLLGLIREGEGVAAKALASKGVSLDDTRKQVEEMIGKGNASPNGHIPFTPHARQVLELSLREALQLGHSYIGTEHILLGLIHEGEGVGTQVLIKMDVNLGELRSATIDLIRGNSGGSQGEGKGDLANAGGVQDRRNQSGSAILDQFGRNLTAEAASGKLDPVIGRSSEIERVMVVLSRRTKNNPVLIGEPGVGKTAVVEGLAQKINAGDVPETLKGKQVYSLDLGSMVAGSRYRGDFEERLKKVLKEIKTRGDIVLFIDEIHRFNKAQQDVLLPYVENGTIILIGATTENPFFEINSPLLSRMKVIRLEHLTADGIKKILERALTDKEKGYGSEGITVTAEALEALADFAGGDARVALNLLEQAEFMLPDGSKEITMDVLRSVAGNALQRYDKKGDYHYDIVSAFIKSMRGSDADAALHYLARMLEGGEDVRFIARRIVICAAEDVGNADPQALVVANAAAQAAHFVGLPEAQIPLAQAVCYIRS